MTTVSSLFSSSVVCGLSSPVSSFVQPPVVSEFLPSKPPAVNSSLTIVLREEEFAPGKNINGSTFDTSDSAKLLVLRLHSRWVVAAGGFLTHSVPLYATSDALLIILVFIVSRNDTKCTCINSNWKVDRVVSPS
ncbi:hypothetical protein F8388_020720 [Cannabis sativa]|uniref:Uncharacterized protein n=1 Tax=Cannabis sativa TaxID=3483 RepID=A0A7J6G554_CANSA|nr:hypothetical protein F8388_020720 [Cannabis sativa]